MPDIFQLIDAVTPEQLGTIRTLFLEYERSIGVSLCFQNFAEEVANLPGRYALPDGRLYICLEGDEIVGCIGLRRLDLESGEIKRLYVRQRYRGRGYGKRITSAIIADARQIGYRRIVLDTLPTMTEAQRIYTSLGFQNIEPYVFNPIEGVRYLGILLKQASHA